MSHAALSLVERSHRPKGAAWTARLSHGLSRLSLYTILTVLAITFLLPMYWMLNISLQPEGALRLGRWFPNPIDWANYWEALTQKGFPFLQLLCNSLVYSGLSTVGILFSCSLVAYSFARLRWPGRDLLFLITLSTMMIPGTVTLIPQFLIFRRLGWTGTYLPLIVPGWLGWPFFIFMLRQFLLTIPWELTDAARIDGASEFAIFRRITMPLCKPALTTVAIFNFLACWNDFFSPLIYLDDPKKFPLSLGLQAFQSRFASQVSRPMWDLLMAACAIVTVPIIVIFFFAQRYFIEGITLTGLKG